MKNQENINEPNSENKQKEIKKTSYIFKGIDNVFSNLDPSSSLKKTNLDLYLKEHSKKQK